jgi:hypothetical protein
MVSIFCGGKFEWWLGGFMEVGAAMDRLLCEFVKVGAAERLLRGFMEGLTPEGVRYSGAGIRR